MASNEEYEVEDITPSNSPDIDSDDDDDLSPRPSGNRIARKEMKNIDDDNDVQQGVENTGVEDHEIRKYLENEDQTETDKVQQGTSFEDISDEDDENEAFSPAEEDEEEDKDIESPESIDNAQAKDNHNTSDNEDFNKEENSRDSSDDELLNDAGESAPGKEAEDEEDLKEDENDPVDDDYIDAPIPSPFSDIGDISGAENAMISDILKETSSVDHISPELEGFAQSLESSDVPVTDSSVKDKEDNDKGQNDGAEPEIHALEAKDSHKEAPTEQDKDGKTAGSHEPSGADVGDENLIADIFGDSDEEDEEFEGFGEEELKTERMKMKSRAIISDDEEDDDDQQKDGQEQSGIIAEAEEDNEAENEIGKVPMPEEEESSDDEKPSNKSEIISDFDLMMQRKKEAMSSRRRRKRDFEIINDNDDIIAAMIRNMRDVAEEDRMLNQAGRAATKKLKMLDSVVSHLNKSDLQHTFIDGGVLPVMKEWLSPLPDNSLPHIMIRKQFLKLLAEFPALDTGALKMSGIGRAVMLLYKHPKETRENRNLAGKIVAQWARPIFGVQTNFKDISKEEREERDKLNAAEYKKRRLSSTDDYPGGSSDAQDEKRPRRPGDKGFIARARVPRPSNKDYVVRPRSDVNLLGEMGGMKNPKKSLNRFEKQMRKYKERKGIKGTAMKAVSISINGSKMSL